MFAARRATLSAAAGGGAQARDEPTRFPGGVRGDAQRHRPAVRHVVLTPTGQGRGGRRAVDYPEVFPGRHLSRPRQRSRSPRQPTRRLHLRDIAGHPEESGPGRRPAGTSRHRRRRAPYPSCPLSPEPAAVQCVLHWSGGLLPAQQPACQVIPRSLRRTPPPCPAARPRCPGLLPGQAGQLIGERSSK